MIDFIISHAKTDFYVTHKSMLNKKVILWEHYCAYYGISGSCIIQYTYWVCTIQSIWHTKKKVKLYYNNNCLYMGNKKDKSMKVINANLNFPFSRPQHHMSVQTCTVSLWLYAWHKFTEIPEACQALSHNIQLQYKSWVWNIFPQFLWNAIITQELCSSLPKNHKIK